MIGNAGATAALRSAMAAIPGIAAVSAPVTTDGLVYLQGTLTSQPVSQAAFSTVSQVRDEVHKIPGADAKVGGGTAVTMDVESYADPRPQRDHPAGAAGRHDHPRSAAAGGGRAAAGALASL